MPIRAISLLLLLLPLTLLANQELSSHPSPYLRSHAGDAVAWRAPGPDALAEAERRNLPLFVSSGYLACYWCHRLKTDTFQNTDLAALLNTAFIPVLIDREVQGEDDRQMQDFARRTLGFSGWPVSVVMTPGRASLKAWPYTATEILIQDLETIARAWAENNHAVAELAQQSSAATALPVMDGDSQSLHGDLGKLLQAFLNQTSQASDSQFGGFGGEAKYPYAPQMQVLLDLNQLNPSGAMTAFLRNSLDAMIEGDLFDPIEGGAFRYTENMDWTTPHFEQMLYTQALLARLMIRASSALAEPRYITVAGQILDNMLERFDAGDGWYVASLSAVGGDGVNGGYYLFQEPVLVTMLGENWRSLIDIRQQYGDRLMVVPKGPLATVTVRSLISLRSQNPVQLDEKRLVSWNGLALSALSHGAALDKKYHAAATSLAEAIMETFDDGGLPQLAGYPADVLVPDLDTLVFAAGGLLDWWQVAGSDEAMMRVVELLELSVNTFHDASGWHRSRPTLFPSMTASLAIADEQLPSPTAEWLRIVVTLQAAGIKLPPGVSRIADEMAEAWPEFVVDSAFFHPTLVGTLVTRRFLGIN